VEVYTGKVARTPMVWEWDTVHRCFKCTFSKIRVWHAGDQASQPAVTFPTVEHRRYQWRYRWHALYI